MSVGKATFYCLVLALCFEILVSTELSAKCVSELQKLSEQSGPYKLPKRGRQLPIGISHSNFLKLVEIIGNEPAFLSSTAIVLYGSRTNFYLGYPPSESSDLDVVVFFLKEMHSVMLQGDITRSLADLSDQLGFRMAQEIPAIGSLEEFIKARSKRDKPEEIIRSIHLVDLIAQDAHWEREVYKERVLNILHANDIAFGLEAVFLFKKKPSPQLLKRLRNIGYRNFIYLDPYAASGTINWL